jgi:hypothetical protein
MMLMNIERNISPAQGAIYVELTIDNKTLCWRSLASPLSVHERRRW